MYFQNNNADLEKSLINLLQKKRQSLDQSLIFGALLTDLSISFEYFSHDLLVAKRIAYGSEFHL